MSTEFVAHCALGVSFASIACNLILIFFIFGKPKP